MSPLERRYGRLLLAYPAPYRAVRGDEILGTLMEAARPGQTRPALRERRALLLGGLRVRFGADRRLPVAVNWRLAAMFGLAILFAGGAGLYITASQTATGTTLGLLRIRVDWLRTAVNLASVAVAVTAWFARRAVVRVAALAVAAVTVATGGVGPTWLAYAVALGGFAALASDRERMPRAWLWPFGLLAAWELGVSVTGAPGTGALPIIWLMVIAALLWITVDGRPAVGLAITLFALTADDAGRMLAGGGSLGSLLQYVPLLVTSVVLAAPGAFRLRRQSML